MSFDIEKGKKRFLALLNEISSERKGIEPLVAWLEKGVFFFADLICKDLPHEKESRLHTIVIDTETTGLDCFKDELLQVSIVSGTGVVLYDSYVKPEVHAEWPMASKINGITPEMVAHAPSTEDNAGARNVLQVFYYGYPNALAISLKAFCKPTKHAVGFCQWF